MWNQKVLQFQTWHTLTLLCVCRLPAVQCHSGVGTIVTQASGYTAVNWCRKRLVVPRCLCSAQICIVHQYANIHTLKWIHFSKVTLWWQSWGIVHRQIRRPCESAAVWNYRNHWWSWHELFKSVTVHYVSSAVMISPHDTEFNLLQSHSPCLTFFFFSPVWLSAVGVLSHPLFGRVCAKCKYSIIVLQSLILWL